MNIPSPKLPSFRKVAPVFLFAIATFVAFSAFTLATPSIERLGRVALAAACSSGSFGFVSSCSNTTYTGNGCTTTTVCKKKWWGFGGSSCQSDTYCPPPSANVQSSTLSSSLLPSSNLSCPSDYPQLCGSTSCIPSGAVCCSTVGFADRFCSANSFCTTDGQCEATSGGQFCSTSYNNACQSAANSCGMQNSGFVSCTGSCQAVVPPDSSCAAPNITLTKTPPFVNLNDTCTVNWTTTHTTLCQLIDLDTGHAVASGLSGQYVTPPITARHDYRLSCKNGTVVSGSADVACILNPAFQEH